MCLFFATQCLSCMLIWHLHIFRLKQFNFQDSASRICCTCQSSFHNAVFKNSMRTFYSCTSINWLDNGGQFPICQDRTICSSCGQDHFELNIWYCRYGTICSCKHCVKRLRKLCVTGVSQPQEGRLGGRQGRKNAVRTWDKFGAKQTLIHVGFTDVTSSRQNLCAFEWH